MEVFGGIEPEIVSLLSPSAGAAIAVHVGLESPRLSSDVSEELEVQLVVCLRERVPVCSLMCCDDGRRKN